MALDLNDAASALRRRWWLIALATLVAAAGAFVISGRQEARYQASANLLFRGDQLAPLLFGTSPPAPDRAPERTAATNVALASFDAVAVRVKRRLSSPLPVAELRDQIGVRPEGEADVVTVTAEGDSPRQAALLANTFAEEAVARRRQASRVRVQRAIDGIRRELARGRFPRGVRRELGRRVNQLEVLRSLRTGDVELAERARPPDNRSGSGSVVNAAVGGILGLLLAAFLVLIAARLDRRVHDEEELTGLLEAPVLARVPAVRRALPNRGIALESFQFLRTNLELLNPHDGQRTLAVTSPLAGDGKTTVVVGLCRALDEAGQTVIAVDGDLRRPALHERFGVDSGEGLVNALVGQRDPVEVLRATDRAGVRVLAAGPRVGAPPSAVIASARLRSVVEHLTRHAEWCVLDTPPLTPAADAFKLADAVEDVLLVVELGKVRRDTLTGVRDQLATAGVNVIGIVLNRVRRHSMSSAGALGEGRSGRLTAGRPVAARGGHGA